MGIKEDEEFIKRLEDQRALEAASDEDIAKYVDLVKSLAQKDNVIALEALASCSYGGNRAFPCDWKLSEKCYLKLLELTDESWYANALGYIYYYGRTADPDYEKAWYYYSIGAAGGWHESQYKIADMLIKGLPKVKNATLAGEILLKTYNESLGIFIDKNFDSKLADTALRMGNYIKEVLIPDNIKFYGWDHEKALYFYLQAKFAIQKRMETGDHIGDITVLNNINKAIEQVSKSVVFQTDLPHITGHSLGDILIGSVGPQTIIEAKINEDATSLRITATRTGETNRPDQMFITVADANFCDFVGSFDVILEKGSEIKILNAADPKDPNTFIINHNQDEVYGITEVPFFEIIGPYHISLNEA